LETICVRCTVGHREEEGGTCDEKDADKGENAGKRFLRSERLLRIHWSADKHGSC
jgi:hypothetical protein